MPHTKREDVQKQIPVDKISTTYRRLNYSKIIISYSLLFMLALLSIKSLHVIFHTIYETRSFNVFLILYLLLSTAILVGVLICSWMFPIWFSKSMSREGREELEAVKRYLESLQVKDLGICMDLILKWVEGRYSPDVYNHLLLITRKLLLQVERDDFNFLTPEQYDLLCILVNPDRVFTEHLQTAKRERLLEVSLILSFFAVHAVMEMPTMESRLVLESRLENCDSPTLKTAIMGAIETHSQLLEHKSELQFRPWDGVKKIPNIIKSTYVQNICKSVSGMNIPILKLQLTNYLIIGVINELTFFNIFIYVLVIIIYLPSLYYEFIVKSSNQYNRDILQNVYHRVDQSLKILLGIHSLKSGILPTQLIISELLSDTTKIGFLKFDPKMLNKIHLILLSQLPGQQKHKDIDLPSLDETAVMNILTSLISIGNASTEKTLQVFISETDSPRFRNHAQKCLWEMQANLKQEPEQLLRASEVPLTTLLQPSQINHSDVDLLKSISTTSQMNIQRDQKLEHLEVKSLDK